MKATFLRIWILLAALVLCSQSAPDTPDESAGNGQAQALLEQAYAQLDAGNFVQAVDLAGQAGKIAEQAGDWITWGDAETTILEAWYYLGKYPLGVATFKKLETRAGSLIPADSVFWGRWFNVGGALYDAVGNYEKALGYGLREVAFFEKQDPNSIDYAIACNNVGTYYRNRGNFDRALEFTRAALQVFLADPEVDPSDLAWTYGNLSKSWYRKREFKQSRHFAEKALEELRIQFPDGDHPEYILAYNDLANSCTELGEYEQALHYLKEALRIHDEQGEEVQKDVTWHNLGYVYRMMGRYAEAEHYLAECVERYGPKHRYYGKACRHLGYIARQKGDYRLALEWQQQALVALTDSFNYTDLLANPSAQRVNAYQDFLFTMRDKGETLRLLAEQESDPVVLESALSAFEIAAGVLDSMRAEYQEGARQFWNEAARPIMEDAVGVAMQLYRLKGELDYLEKAFQFAEKSKALLLAEALRESAAREKAGIPDSILQQEKDLKISIAFYKKEIFSAQQSAKPDRDRILLWETQILELRRTYEALLQKLEREYPEYYSIKYNQSEIKLSAVQEALPEQTGLVEYFVGDRDIYAFYLDRDSARGYRFHPDSLFNQTLDQFVQDLRNREQVLERGRSSQAVDAYARSAGYLCRTLVTSVVEKLPAQLIIIPDAKLAYLPFELLVADTARLDRASYADLDYLLLHSTIRYEYSAGMAIKPPVRRKARHTFAGYAPEYSGAWTGAATRDPLGKNCREADPADFAPLDNNRAEVTEIAGLMGGQAMLGQAATEEAFREKVQEAGILHLAMHGFLNDCDPLYSGLVFARQSRTTGPDTLPAEEDGFLHAYELYNLRLRADLAVLSACNTGRGKLARGEGVQSLARAFKYAGCANVLMSLWQAEDRATARIMSDFYRYLQQGWGKDAALRQAKLDYLKADVRNHPFFWGAFVLIGDAEPVVRPASWWWYGGLVLLFIALGAGFWYSKRRKARTAH
ncbi:MAG: CHAT domain-containing protein [Bacteroidetes bacterium]|nr:MAG: CHAT domain-containing protein [Bacteroidota bacterium]